MTRSRYKILSDQYPYFITCSAVYGLPLFAIPSNASIVLQSLRFLQNDKNVTVSAYVIMENHMHLIAKSEALAKKIREFRSFTARKIIDALKANSRNVSLKRLKEQKQNHKTDRKFQLWQEGYHPKQVIGDKMMKQKIEYIHNNPVKRGYVEKPVDWRYSSARNYEGMYGLVPVTLFRGRGE